MAASARAPNWVAARRCANERPESRAFRRPRHSRTDHADHARCFALNNFTVYSFDKTWPVLDRVRPVEPAQARRNRRPRRPVSRRPSIILSALLSSCAEHLRAPVPAKGGSAAAPAPGRCPRPESTSRPRRLAEALISGLILLLAIGDCSGGTSTPRRRFEPLALALRPDRLGTSA